MSQKGRALIAMSGGVDSSVAAWLTLQDGFDCIGVTMRLCGDSGNGNSGSAESDAAAVARQLGIPFQVCELTGPFRDRVLRPFAESYWRGETPNPCVLCNRYIKFGVLWEEARRLGCDTLVTGHYARILCADGRWTLCKALDSGKDQSYFLHYLSQELLSHVRFPLGGLRKEETRRIAGELGLAVTEKKESQDICFVPDGDYARIVEQVTGRTCPEGEFVDESGRVLGRHRGIIRYTVGQRRGLGVSAGGRLYVQEVRPGDNTVVLGENASLFSRGLTAGEFHWIAGEPPREAVRVRAKIRYRHTEQPAVAEPLLDGRVRVLFDEPQRAVTRGQSVVLYDGEEVLGGGVILERG